jgi:hypothetical protein
VWICDIFYGEFFEVNDFLKQLEKRRCGLLKKKKKKNNLFGKLKIIIMNLVYKKKYIYIYTLYYFR